MGAKDSFILVRAHFQSSSEGQVITMNEINIKVSNRDMGIHLKAAGILFTYISTLKLPHTYLT